MAALTALVTLAVAVQAHLSVTPARVGVGDRVTAQAVVTIDPKRVDPATVRVSFGVAPLAELGPVEQTGLRFSAVAACLDESCVPNAKPRALRLAPLRVTGRMRDGRPFATRFAWPALVLAPRVPASALRGNPPLRLETTPPPARYRVAPGTLAALLDALAAVLALAVAGTLVRLRRRAAVRRAERARDPLERALALVRESVDRPPQDRRRALNLLAGLLDRRLAEQVETLAWSRAAPAADATEHVADDVERTVRR